MGSGRRGVGLSTSLGQAGRSHCPTASHAHSHGDEASSHDATRPYAGPTNSHVNPLIRSWAAPLTLSIAGLRAIERVNTRNSGFACEHAHHARHRCAHNADHFATSSPFSVFFTEVVCDLSATPLQTTAAPPPIGGNCTTRGSDTPATRRQKASCSAKPPPVTGLEAAASPPRPAQYRLARQNSPNTTAPEQRARHSLATEPMSSARALP